MKKKKVLTAVTSLLLAFGLCAMSACEGVTVTPDGSGGVVVKPLNPGNVTVTPDGNGGLTITPGTTSSDGSSATTPDSSTNQTPEIPDTSETPSDSTGNEGTETPDVPETPTPETPQPENPTPDDTTPETPAVCNHIYTWTTVEEATCDTYGFQTGVCGLCGDTDSRTITKLNHNYVGNNCTYCGDELVKSDQNDLSTSKYVSTKIIDKWIAHSTLEVQATTTAPNSTSALKGTFNAKDADGTYDSSQDPNGDGGQWAWTALTLNLKELCGGSADLDGYTFSFDIKMDNADTTSSIILYNSAEQRSAQVPFNISPATTEVGGSSYNGLSKKVLADGWVRISIDLDQTFAGYAKVETDELYIMLSNAYGDYTKDVVYYVENMCFKNKSGDKVTPAPIQADSDDLGKGNCIYDTKLGAWMVKTDIKLQKDETNGSTTAICGRFNLKDAEEWYDSTQDPNGDGGKWVWSAFTLDLKELYGKSVDFRGYKLSFDIKVENGSQTTSLTYIDSDGYRPTELPVNNSDDADNVSNVSGFTKTVLSDGWVRITANLDILFANEDVSKIDKIILIFSNANGDYVNDTVYYIDNIKMKLTLR